MQITNVKLLLSQCTTYWEDCGN